MSTTMHWRPTPDGPTGEQLPATLKYVLARRFMDHDGTQTGSATLGEYDVPYLEGLRDAYGPRSDVARGLDELMAEIRRRGGVEVYIP